MPFAGNQDGMAGRLPTVDQSMRSWLGALARALTFYGGVPQLIVPDNPRSLVSEACRSEPRLNATVREFARHYDVSFLPARPYSPKDKATAESSVQVVTRWMAQAVVDRLEVVEVDEQHRELFVGAV